MSGQIKTQTLVERLALKLNRPVPIEARNRAGLHLIDWLGCAVAGSREPAGRIMLAAQEPGAGADAFAWGALGNILEMDDVDKRATLHPGPSIIPAILALASLIDAPADDILDAIVTGYEATIRLGRAVGPGHYAFWHSTGTCGPIGAAAACARLFGMGPGQVAQALALAMSQASGLWQTRHEPESMGKQFHTAQAARAGLDSARLSALGFRGPLAILEGPQGFFAATCPGADPERVLADYESDWLIEDVSFKPWPACRHTHAAIDAALLVHTEQVRPSDIVSVRVSTYPDALKFCDNPNPHTTIEAKFSLQHAVASVLLRGMPSLADFEPEAIRDPTLASLRSQVSIDASAPFASAYPARFGAAVEVTGRHNGAAFSSFQSVPDALGDPENPLSFDQICEKALTLMQHAGLTGADAHALVAACSSPGKPLVDQLRGHLA